MASALLASPLLCLRCMPASQAWCSTVRANKRLRPNLQQRCGCKQRRLQTCALADSGASTKALKETAALDQLIDLFLGAKSQQQLAKLVADNIMSLDQKFWLRLATRSDTASSQDDKQKIGSLANTVMNLANAVVKQTEGQLDQSASTLQNILVSAADERGEWHLPLTQEQSQSMQQALDRHLGTADEALLSTAFSWMRKAADDKQDGMIALIQKMLQLYAAKALQHPRNQSSAVDQVIAADEDKWEPLIRQFIESEQTTEAEFSQDLQKRMEATLLSQTSGSYMQRVQAEYLKEIEARFKEVYRTVLDQGAS